MGGRHATEVGWGKVGGKGLSFSEAGFFRFLLILTLLVAGIALIQGLAPPNDYDSMNYHLALPKYDLELGHKGIPWDRHIGVMFLPSLGGNLTRIALALVDDRAAQIIHGLFCGVAAIGSAMLTLRLGYGRIVAVLAALMFLCIRSVVWQMATVETDYLLAAALITALLLYLVYRKAPEERLAILLGILLGCAVLIKLSGFVFIAALGPIYLYDLIRRRVFRSDLLLALVFLIVITPHLVKSYLVTGNPFYPMLADLLFSEISGRMLVRTGAECHGQGCPLGALAVRIARRVAGQAAGVRGDGGADRAAGRRERDDTYSRRAVGEHRADRGVGRGVGAGGGQEPGQADQV